MGKVLALDYGSKNIGVATGDFQFKMAFPRDVIANKGLESVLEALLSICNELNVELVVLGLPLNMKAEHKENKIEKDVRALKSALEEVGVKVELVDERLSSFEAKQLTGKKRDVDAEAAQIILQRYFDNLAS
jgi:putative holliday junction resolvase